MIGKNQKSKRVTSSETVKNQNERDQTGNNEDKLAEVSNLKNQLARALADYDNLRKRTEVEKETWFKFSSQRILVSLLPILDSLESALAHLQDQGLAIAVGEFKKIVTEEGLTEISPKVGDDFDHNLHEAVESLEGGETGKIAELILSGWKFTDGPVIRYAKVKVYGEDLTNQNANIKN